MFFAVDLVWLSVATKRLYRPYIGGLAYAIYDLTNLATLRGWAWQVTAIDLVWGTTVTSVVAVAGYYAGRWLGIGQNAAHAVRRAGSPHAGSGPRYGRAVGLY